MSGTVPGAEVVGAAPGATTGTSTRRRRRTSATLVVGGVLVALVVLGALLSLVWTPHPIDLPDPSAQFSGPTASHPLGTDEAGRDLLSRLMVGARTTMLVGVVAVGIAIVLGVPYGILAAMAPRWAGGAMMRVNDIALAFPAILLALMLRALYDPSILISMVAIGLATVPSFARVARASTVQVLSQEYVLAARAAGRGRAGIAVHHVLPNIAGMVLVQASVSFAMAILAEAALSFLGVGAGPDVPAWGRLLDNGKAVMALHPLLVVVPGVAIALAVLGFNLLGDGLRDVLDPTLQERS